MKKYRAIYSVSGWRIQKRCFLFFWKTLIWGISESMANELMHDLKTKKIKY